MKVSIIIPIYNEEKTIGRLLHTLEGEGGDFIRGRWKYRQNARHDTERIYGDKGAEGAGMADEPGSRKEHRKRLVFSPL